MSQSDLPSGLTQFILERIVSVEQIDILRLLHSEADRRWSILKIAAELRSTEPSIAKRLADLYTTGVLNSPPPQTGTITYIPSSQDVGQLVELLIEAYRTHPNRVIGLIYSRPPHSLKAFADAFKFKKD